MNILICTICRNTEDSFERYIVNLKRALSNVNHNIRYNLYENNSTDNTKNIIKNTDFSFLNTKPFILSEDLDNVCNTGGTTSTRVRRLANARNKCLKLNDNHIWADYIIFIECDIEYDENFINTLIERGIENKIDIFSGVAYTCNSNIPYDTWAVRNTKFSPPFSTFISKNKQIRRFWSTFSCICMYNAVPFKNGIEFHYINPRTQSSDCDTTVICELFHAQGFTRVYVDERLDCRHFVEGLITFSIEPGEYSDYIYNIIRNAVKSEDDVMITTDDSIRTREWLCRITNVFTPPNLIKELSFNRKPVELFDHKNKTIHISEALKTLSLE